MDATIYKPEVAWRTKARNVVQVTPETAENPATYKSTVKPIDVTELGASPVQVAVNDYLMDFTGTPYLIENVSGNVITVRDSFRSKHCPTSGQTAIVYRSVGDGNSPYLAPVYYRFLDKQALANSKRFELDILWKKLYSEKYVTDPAKWLKNTFSNLIEFGQALGLDHSVNGNQSTAIGTGNQTQSFREIILGSYAKDTASLNPTEWNILDLLFTLGNGTDDANRSNAIEVFKSGLIKTYNALLIGEYSHGAIAPVAGMLQYTALNGLQIWEDGAWAEVGKEQLQADWTQADNTQKDFIKNKPTLATAFTELTDVIDEDYIGKTWYVPRVSDTEETLELEETEELQTVLAKLTELADFPPTYTGYGNMLLMVNATVDGVGFVTTLPVYADNAAALTGGLVAGNIYRTSDGTMKIVF